MPPNIHGGGPVYDSCLWFPNVFHHRHTGEPSHGTHCVCVSVCTLVPL